MSKWISVKDALPSKPGEYFVVLTNPFKIPGRYITIDEWDGTDWVQYSHAADYMRWTKTSYWMECPEIPKE